MTADPAAAAIDHDRAMTLLDAAGLVPVAGLLDDAPVLLAGELAIGEPGPPEARAESAVKGALALLAAVGEGPDPGAVAATLDHLSDRQRLSAGVKAPVLAVELVVLVVRELPQRSVGIPAAPLAVLAARLIGALGQRPAAFVPGPLNAPFHFH